MGRRTGHQHQEKSETGRTRASLHARRVSRWSASSAEPTIFLKMSRRNWSPTPSTALSSSHPAGGASAARLEQVGCAESAGGNSRSGEGRPSARSSTSRARRAGLSGARRFSSSGFGEIGERLVGGVIVADGEGRRWGRRSPAPTPAAGGARGGGARRRPFPRPAAAAARRRRRGRRRRARRRRRRARRARRRGRPTSAACTPRERGGGGAHEARGERGAEELRARRQVGRRRRGRAPARGHRLLHLHRREARVRRRRPRVRLRLLAQRDVGGREPLLPRALLDVGREGGLERDAGVERGQRVVLGLRVARRAAVAPLRLVLQRADPLPQLARLDRRVVRAGGADAAADGALERLAHHLQLELAVVRHAPARQRLRHAPYEKQLGNKRGGRRRRAVGGDIAGASAVRGDGRGGGGGRTGPPRARRSLAAPPRALSELRPRDASPARCIPRIQLAPRLAEMFGGRLPREESGVGNGGIGAAATHAAGKRPGFVIISEVIAQLARNDRAPRPLGRVRRAAAVARGGARAHGGGRRAGALRPVHDGRPTGLLRSFFTGEMRCQRSRTINSCESTFFHRSRLSASVPVGDDSVDRPLTARSATAVDALRSVPARCAARAATTIPTSR